MFLELCLSLSVLWLVYKWWTSVYSYWEARGFPSIKARFPLGSSPGLSLFQRYQGDVTKELYLDMGEEPYVGLVLVRRPHLLVKDPEVIKQIMLKDFSHFTDRLQSDLMKEPMAQHLFNIGGERWKAKRMKLTPTFTSGKLKLMFGLFQECSKELDGLLQVTSKESGECDIKDVITRFTTDVIGSCAFGLEVSTIKNPDNMFRKMCLLIFPPTVSLNRKLKHLFNAFFPGIEKYFTFAFLPKNLTDFMNALVLDTFSHRERTGFHRNDFIDLLLEIREKGSLKSDDENAAEKYKITDDDLVAEVFVFLAAGFETSSSVTSYCLYELALNQEIQTKLRAEIKEVTKKHGGVTYQAIHDMQYLDQVIHETMRKYPTLPILTRKCTKKYRMPDRPDRVLEEGVRVLIPVFALHRDPKYFPEPDKFNPDRFSSENKARIPPFAYLPFGDGPRICIGMRFGLMQTKMGVVTALSKYRVSRSPNTHVPLRLVPSGLITTVQEPIYLIIKPLQEYE